MWTHPGVWETGGIPSHWLEAELSLLYKKGNTASAMSYRPISVSNYIYIVLARLILNAIQLPINTALCDTQAGSREGYTTSQQPWTSLWNCMRDPKEVTYVFSTLPKPFLVPLMCASWRLYRH